MVQKIKEACRRQRTTLSATIREKDKINIETCQTETIKSWIYNVKEVIQKVEKLPLNNVRRYCEC